MPNYCTNLLYVQGDAMMVAEFHRRFTKYGNSGEKYSFQGFIPDPGTNDKRDEAWGTKWDACFCSIEMSAPDFMGYQFETAWAPPIPVVHAMQREFPELNIEMFFEEPGWGFQGSVLHNGTVIQEDYEEEEAA